MKRFHKIAFHFLCSRELQIVIRKNIMKGQNFQSACVFNCCFNLIIIILKQVTRKHSFNNEKKKIEEVQQFEGLSNVRDLLEFKMFKLDNLKSHQMLNKTVNDINHITTTTKFKQGLHSHPIICINIILKIQQIPTTDSNNT